MADTLGRIHPTIQAKADNAATGPVRLVLFDIDGTLVSTGGAGMKAFGEAFEAGFGIADATEKIKFAGRTDYSLFREMCRHGGIDCTAENRELFFSHYLRLVDSHLDASKGGPFPGVVRMLDELAAMPDAPALGLLPGNIREGARRKRDVYGMWERLAVGGFSEDSEERNLTAAAAEEAVVEFPANEVTVDATADEAAVDVPVDETPAVRVVDASEVEAIDLLGAAGAPILKRLVPTLLAVVAVVVIILILV